jgi:hypothetical protein
VSDLAIQGVTSSTSVHDEPVAQPAYAFSSGSNYGRLVYGRTAAVLATLAGVYGDDGVARALGRYARRFRFEHPRPSDLVDAFAEVLGEGAAAVLRSALFDKGWVDYAVDGAWSERDRSSGGEWQGCVVVRRRGTLVLPVDVELLLADGTTHRERWSGEGDWQRIAWHGAVALRGAVVDPDHKILIEDRLTDNHAAVRDGGGSTLRSMERLTYFAELALQAMSP